MLIIGLGLRIRLSNAKQSVRIDNIPNNMSAKITGSLSVRKNFMASKNGSKYYPVGCKAGERIKLENRIFFANEEEARASGYTRTTNCD